MAERIGIVGTRPEGWSHPFWTERCVRVYVRSLADKDVVIVSGAARGVDSWAADEARKLGLKVIEYPPDYAAHGKGATLKRNWQIIYNSDRIVAFWNNISKGTAHTINGAESEGKPVLVIDPLQYKPKGWLEPADYAF